MRIREFCAGEAESAIRARLIVGTEVELVEFGTLPRRAYEIRLVDYSEADSS